MGYPRVGMCTTRPVWPQHGEREGAAEEACGGHHESMRGQGEDVGLELGAEGSC